MIPFTLKYTKEAADNLFALKDDPSKQRILKDVVKTLRLMETNLRHRSLNTHEYHNLAGPNGEKVFEARTHNKVLLVRIAFFGVTEQEKISSPS